MIKFEKPEYKISEYNESSNYGKFELEPLERGFGTTIGNALRRVLLSSLPGSSVVSIKIDGVMHEFQKIDGIIEDVTQIVLNVKKLVVKCHVDGFKTIKLSASTEGPVTAGMIEKDADVDIINEDLVICNLVKGGKIDMELTISNGRGYVEAKTNKILLKDAKESIYPNYFKGVNISYYTKTNFDKNLEIFSLNKGVTKVRVYMWIEGQDVDCENNASVGNVSLNLQFSKNPN